LRSEKRMPSPADRRPQRQPRTVQQVGSNERGQHRQPICPSGHPARRRADGVCWSPYGRLVRTGRDTGIVDGSAGRQGCRTFPSGIRCQPRQWLDAPESPERSIRHFIVRGGCRTRTAAGSGAEHGNGPVRQHRTVSNRSGLDASRITIGSSPNCLIVSGTCTTRCNPRQGRVLCTHVFPAF
jgi:hypothetical protein